MDRCRIRRFQLCRSVYYQSLLLQLRDSPDALFVQEGRHVRVLSATGHCRPDSLLSSGFEVQNFENWCPTSIRWREIAPGSVTRLRFEVPRHTGKLSAAIDSTRTAGIPVRRVPSSLVSARRPIPRVGWKIPFFHRAQFTGTEQVLWKNHEILPFAMPRGRDQQSLKTSISCPFANHL